MRLPRWLNGRTAVYLYVLALWLLLTGLAWTWADGTVMRTYDAVSRLYLAAAQTSDDSGWIVDATAVDSLPTEIAQDASRFGQLDDAGRMHAGWFADYRRQLAWTLCLVLPVAALLPLLVYMLAALVEEGVNRVAPWRSIPERVIELFDQLPYILWSLIAISTAFWFFHAQPFGRLPESLYHAAYRLITLTGFGLFLFVFLFREQRDRLRSLQRSGIIDAERVTGISSLRIYQRLFRYRFKPVFLRQMLYLALFIMLLEFSFNIIHPFHMAGGAETVFSHGGELFRQARRADRNALLAHGEDTTPQKTLQQWAEQPGERGTAATRLLTYPELLIGPSPWGLSSDQAPSGGMGASDNSGLRLQPIDRQAAYWAAQRDAYIALNALMLFSLFMLLFIRFDLPVLVEEKET
jgi:hypothetical protein